MLFCALSYPQSRMIILQLCSTFAIIDLLAMLHVCSSIVCEFSGSLSVEWAACPLYTNVVAIQNNATASTIWLLRKSILKSMKLWTYCQFRQVNQGRRFLRRHLWLWSSMCCTWFSDDDSKVGILFVLIDSKHIDIIDLLVKIFYRMHCTCGDSALEFLIHETSCRTSSDTNLQ